MLGAIFMATDYVTSPVTSRGRLIFGVGCGLLTVFFRYFGSYPEGVSFAILVMNCLVYYLDKLTLPRVFGGVRHAKK
ncbi:MAG: RnfABCDGE type electron transport complex subunit D, partial [Clostridia bacterium]|nr:RnfABCDGE type electron transport complex subunit D [Clostridia bacterium]